jgi:hypothetical protein
VLYGEVNNVENLQVKFDGFVQSDVLLTVPTYLPMSLFKIFKVSNYFNNIQIITFHKKQY